MPHSSFPTHTSTVIIGAGLSGLSCALHLGHDYLLLEKEASPGGVVRTEVTQTPYGPFFCDGTGHWLHLRTPEIRELVERLLDRNLVEISRRAVISLRGTFTPYPFQANTYGLPRQIVCDCLLGYLQAKHPPDFGLTPPAAPPKNFRESLERLFGHGICQHFLIPYNQKLLGVPLEEISPEYATRFIPQPAAADVIKGALGFSREALGYNARFLYPCHGGISALPQAFAKALPVPPRYGTRVVQIDPAQKKVTLSDGKEVAYQTLVNTIPLPRLMEMLGPLPEAVQTAVSRLRATTVYYFDIGIRGSGGPAASHHWTYFPEEEFLFYRVGSYSAVHSPSAPEGCHSFYVEMSGLSEAWLENPGALKQRVIADLLKAGVLDTGDELLFVNLRKIPFAYVIFDHHYLSARQTLLDYLATLSIQSIGRWGGWNYGGMEDAILEGKHAAETIGL